MAASHRARRATVSDLIVALLLVTVFALIVYVFFLTYLTKKLHKFQLYLNPPRYITPAPIRTEWGGNDDIIDLSNPGDLGHVFPHAFPANLTMTVKESNVLPVEYYLGNGNRAARCDRCNKFYVKPVISNNACFKSENLVILLLIFSMPENIDRRNAIRQTWLSPFVNNNGTMRHLFLLGLSEMIKYDSIVQQENSIHQDILQGDFIEDYQNLTLKTLMGLNWAVKHCHGANTILKIDDDVWLNAKTTVKKFIRTPKKFSFGGKCLPRVEPVRDPRSKWYASFQSYPDVHYPPYCSGPGYVLTMETAAQIVVVSEFIPYFHLEDVYVGMCLKALKIRVKQLKGFLDHVANGSACYVQHNTIVLAHGFTPERMKRVWHTLCRARKRTVQKHYRI